MQLSIPHSSMLATERQHQPAAKPLTGRSFAKNTYGKALSTSNQAWTCRIQKSLPHKPAYILPLPSTLQGSNIYLQFTMATLNLTMEDFDKVDAKKAAAEKTTFNVSRAFIIVRDFLQPESTIRLDAAADDIVAMLPDEVSSVDSFEFSAMCVELAEQIPYSHPSHIKLARLVFRLARCQKLSYNVMSAVCILYLVQAPGHAH